MTHTSIINDIKSGKLANVYLLHGEEPFFVDEIMKAAEQYILTPAEKSFNQTIFYGKEFDIDNCLSALNRFPMMAKYQLVLLREAQQVHHMTLPKLEPYVINPNPQTIFFIIYKNKKMDQRTALAKALKKHAVVFESKRIYDNKVAPWIGDHVKSSGFQIGSKATQILAEYLGNDLAKISNELTKLFLNVESGSEITPEIIQEVVGISKEYNMFELSNALLVRDISRANKITYHYTLNMRKFPLQPILGNIFNVFSKLYIAFSTGKVSDQELAQMIGVNPYFIKDYRRGIQAYGLSKTKQVIALLKDYDLKSKGVGVAHTQSDQLLKELVFQILH